nr:reverse transcriptase domain-containing protein [Tanacetum cinerariifolium]
MFDPQDFFLPEEILPPQKRAYFRSSSSTSTLPQVQKALLASSTGLNELNQYFPVTTVSRTTSEVKKMEDEFYNLTVKGNDLKTYVRILQELAVLYPTMMLNYKKLMEVFIEGLPRSIEGNVTVSKPQTLKEAITIT